jgi:hypothetical protein
MKEKRFNFQEFVVNFLFGARLGAPMGFGIWAASVRGELLFHGSNWYNSYTAACLFIGGGAFLGGLFFALYKGSRGYW